MSRFSTVLFVVLVLLAGCGKPEDKLVGHYNGKLTLSSQAQAKATQAGPQAQQLLDALNNATFGLQLNQDKTYSLTTNMMGNNISGKWSLDNKQITLQRTNDTGDASGTPSKFNPSEDGNTLTAVNTSDPNTTMIFTKG